MDFTMASQLKAGKIAKEARAATQTTVQKGTGDKPKVGADAISVTKATSAPKAASTIQQAHRGDARTAPKVADFTQDRRAEAGEFESSAAPSTADTATHRQDRVGELQAGEFESSASASKADTATYRADRVGELQAGEFESSAQSSRADTAAHRQDRIGEVQAGEFESEPAPRAF